MSFFNSISLLPGDSILSLAAAFKADPNPNKVNLGIGAYKTADNKSLVMTCVSKAEAILQSAHLDKEYLPIEGDSEFLKAAAPILFGTQSPALVNENLFITQTIGGTGALRIGAEFLAANISPVIYVSNMTWPNHQQIFERAGLTVHTYPYYDSVNHRLKFNELCEAVKKMPPASAIMLQGCCHNPTGMDLSFEQWKELSELLKKQRVLPFFDNAYQGFHTDLESDVKAIRYFIEQGHEIMVANSYAKNFGLYGERVGFLAIVTNHAQRTQHIASHFKHIIRASYSSPVLHGARIVSTVLRSPELINEWKEELQNMKDRIVEMRQALIASLMVKAKHKDFSFMHNQHGMFSLCGLDEQAVNRLKKEKSLYIPNSGRINIAGINTLNLEYVSEAIASVI